VPVFSQPEEKQVMAVNGLSHPLCNGVKLRLALGRSLVRLYVTLDLEHVTHRQRDPAEQCLEGHPKIAVRTVRWNTALVSKGDLDRFPRKRIRVRGQGLVNRAGGSASRQAQTEHSVPRYGLTAGFNDQRHGVFNKFWGA
jgi:hypothetical protein